MSAAKQVKALVKEITSLSISLPQDVPYGTTEDKIWIVLNTAERETPWETFNHRFDAVFGEDCRDVNGRLHLLRQGKYGMGAVCMYLSRISWTSSGFPLDLAEIKLRRLVTELRLLA
jgi:hypothetical protein